MFYKCTSLQSLNLINLVGKNVVRMSQMFENCYKLINLDLSNFEASPRYMSTSFKNCHSLRTLRINKLKGGDALYPQCIFENCYSLESLDLSSFTNEDSVNLDIIFSYESITNNVFNVRKLWKIGFFRYL